MSLPLTTLIELGGLRFLITDKPTKANVPLCVDVFKKLGVTALVRVCHEEDYDTTPIQNAGITCYALAFDDGSPPPDGIIDSWLDIVQQVFSKKKKKNKGDGSKGGGKKGSKDVPCIAIHCVAGLGRAPLMVTLALVNAGITYTKAVEAIRAKRPGCINNRQLTFLKRYKPSKKHKIGKGGDDDCTIM
mmetsp:Transcript_9852/g.14425  ORF Transcript_9852/g.14425 Transcript_9852/m.14425 type:complete len:188 (-) Transcript_9852:117-680(-)|eukprot:CAMPEP_0195512376 /NCGR_PEP_ID=MMETSP0794_2-20130614/4359_1 /TAXON_ID=515487 /ORGANISM="Stephanopyxis turris, Strain CCMP 815" /LENGTH=187 /DNA_ID=CAMNT_0040640149 /DNA_START=201 /DNA_END=764 /DNA_ORIENTATION=+